MLFICVDDCCPWLDASVLETDRHFCLDATEPLRGYSLLTFSSIFCAKHVRTQARTARADTVTVTDTDTDKETDN
jgi:hypothetical protein